MEEFPEQQGGGPVLVRQRPPTPAGLRKTLKARLRGSCVCSLQGARGLLLDLFPVTRWLRRYRLREDLAGDVMSGLVVGIILVPQAIAYLLLAGLQPIYSLYTSFFVNLIYFLMGTSRHVSMASPACSASWWGRWWTVSSCWPASTLPRTARGPGTTAAPSTPPSPR